MGWGVPRRPKIATKLGNPNPREGSDGDISIKGTALGAKLFAKWSGRWWDIPLSIDGVTKFGVTDSNYLSIDRDSVDIYTNNVKVATFGATTTIGNFEATSAGIVTVTDLFVKNAINTEGGTTDIMIGSDNGGGIYNIGIGTGALENSSTSACVANIAIGTGAGGNIATVIGNGGTYNTCLGHQSGNTITKGDHNITIGNAADCAATLNEQIAIGYQTTCDTAETMRIGDANSYVFCDFSGTGVTTLSATSDIRVKKNIVDTDIGLDFINSLRPVKYVSKNKSDYPDELFQDGVNPLKDEPRGPDPTGIVDGFIGQEVKEVMDDLNVTFAGWRENNSSRQMLSYSIFVVPLTKAVQELSTKLDTMQQEINNLKQG